ncbi:MAG: hypothetical protein H7145_16095 [Akkermansiaceae bacterium]|nr:hypothetical protein [Armatimonadota bacterium]
MDRKRGQWLRPVGMTDEGELYPTQYRLSDCSEPEPWDIIEVPLYETVSRKPHHPEDRKIAGTPWGLIERGSPTRTLLRTLENVCASGPDLFGCTGKRTLPAAIPKQKNPASLTLIRPAETRIKVEPNPQYLTIGELPSHRYRVRFFLNGALYELPLTDTRFKKRLRYFDTGYYTLSEVGLPPGKIPYLVCSLGEPYKGYCYKLVATVLMPPD